MNRDGKGVYEKETRKPTLGFFFKLWFRKFSQLIQLNLLMLIQASPVIAIALIYLTGSKTPTVTNVMFAPLYGLGSISPSPSITTMLDLSSIQMEIPVLSPTVMIVMLILFVIYALTFPAGIPPGLLNLPERKSRLSEWIFPQRSRKRNRPFSPCWTTKKRNWSDSVEWMRRTMRLLRRRLRACRDRSASQRKAW